MSDLTVIKKHGYRIIIAGERTLNEASTLVQTRYAWRGYSVSLDKFSNGDITFCAKSLKSVIATASLRFKRKDRPLLCEASFKAELAEIYRLCNGSGKAAEIIRLAAEPNHIPVIATLLHVLVLYAVQNGVTHFMAEINPRHTRLYRDCFGFRMIGEPRDCERAGAPAVLMHTNPIDLSALIARSECARNSKQAGIIVYKLEATEVTKLLSFFESYRAQVPFQGDA